MSLTKKERKVNGMSARHSCVILTYEQVIIHALYELNKLSRLSLWVNFDCLISDMKKMRRYV
jgi:hypothetical protein